ncbi:hypothetical protein AALP_AA1G335500 [Arabis alpina]|uniref:F-box domain-containing protein n=1 Tax=Arabis alpina TaxID=50452 RepID=A0A087HSD1_ARAAL|nr:hypothetical protein AALP_AA1G335500 [Arabis alpina]
MKSRRRNISSNNQTTVRHRTRSSTIIDGRYYSEPLPIELIIEILTRLPLKSIAKCRCVSKRWSSILRLPYFTDLFLTRSYTTQPQILFAACKNDGEVIFFTSQQPKNPDEKSLPLTANHRMRIQCNATANLRMRMPWMYGYVSAMFSVMSTGFVYIRDDSVICNPSTRQSFALPKFRTKMHDSRSYFAYDPTEKQFKVLSVTLTYRGEYNANRNEHRVLILGSGKPSWRVIECSVPHYPRSNGVCIDGVLYYIASAKGSFDYRGVICFDVKSEKYSFVDAIDTFVGAAHGSATLVNYMGKLASVKPEKGSNTFRGSDRSFEMYVLEDSEKQEWSTRVYELPSLWKNVVGENTSLQCVGMIGANEIVFSTRFANCIFYYNIERKTVTRVQIEGMEAFYGEKISIFLHHAEDVKLL